MSRNAPPKALRDIQKNGCEGDYGYTCLLMIYKQRNLLSFVLVRIVERAQKTFSVLANVSSC